jgi:hypothetical protein
MHAGGGFQRISVSKRQKNRMFQRFNCPSISLQADQGPSQYLGAELQLLPDYGLFSNEFLITSIFSSIDFSN